jgi:hypothetical protein
MVKYKLYRSHASAVLPVPSTPVPSLPTLKCPSVQVLSITVGSGSGHSACRKSHPIDPPKILRQAIIHGEQDWTDSQTPSLLHTCVWCHTLRTSQVPVPHPNNSAPERKQYHLDYFPRSGKFTRWMDGGERRGRGGPKFQPVA